MDYRALAKRLLLRAKRRGARQAEAFVQVGRESSCRVRDGQIEELTQATAKGVGIRVIWRGRLGFAYSSDFEPSSLDAFVDRAVELARTAAPNPFNGLPTKEEAGRPAAVGGLFDREVAELPSEWKVRAALEMEKAGRAVDPRIRTFESLGAGDSVSEVYLASSEGLAGQYAGTSVYLYASPVASDGGQLQTSYWYDTKRFLGELEPPERVGSEAARRALRMLGARKVKSQRVPVVFEPLLAASFVGAVAAAANGDAVHKKSSFLASRLGQRLGGVWLTLVDDGTLPGGLGSAPFDGEGVAARRTTIIRGGVLEAFLYDTFTARKARARSTGNASRAYRSLPGIGTRNLFLEPGNRAPQDIIREVKNGFFVTAMLGQGANIVTGDYSRGANGLWIRDGELAEPVQEVTVAGNAIEMLDGIDAVGSDLEFRGSTAAPTLRFAELTVSGE
ncbi:MAG: TldD/PmbA family protein [Myxococcales bacterium]|nr:TldD/PmbA family protein [Myxococcales bacterium]